MGRLGYNNGNWMLKNANEKADYERGIIGLSPDRRKASPTKSNFKKKRYS
jgi:hypothetical protein